MFQKINKHLFIHINECVYVCACVFALKEGVKGGTNNIKKRILAIDGKINEHFITSVEKLI